MRRRHFSESRTADCLVVLFAWVLSSSGASGSALAVQVLIGGLASVALFWRQTRPVPVLSFNLVCTLAMQLLVSHPVLPGALAVALYAIGRHARPSVSWVVAAIAGLIYGGMLVVLHALGLPVLSRDASGQLPMAFIIAALLLFPLFLLVALGTLVRLRHELKERDRAELEAAAVRTERMRIARELHDVVAHHISTVNVLLGAARTIMRKDPERAEATLATAERNGRDAIAELRHLLYVLRAEQTRRPQSEDHAAGVAILPALVNRARETGQQVRLEMTGEPFPLGTTVDNAVYRIVQEALTNSRKHAVGATATVTVAYLPGAVEVQVSDDGPAVQHTTETGGFGLRGIAERVALCGGELQIGSVPEGGFRVRARIPADQGVDRR
ncbi:sensor histidine kinase [Streptosporangium sp. NPDC000396]|uniref:sensor histidine kinase n=1 Tax=Streptosporangium sp. NPDC000396 TaxID=3366185 RepID=UPI00369E63A3